MGSATENGLTMSDLVGNPMLRAYLKNLRDWHGYVRFLGLPDRRDNPDILIDRLFVEPLVTRRHIWPDEDPSSWIDEAETIFDVLKIGGPVVLLGDPGTGKTTLLNYLVWLLARPTVDTWTKRMGGWLLPVPMVLREQRLRGITNFDGLLDTFFSQPKSEPLRKGKYLYKMLEEGRALILLDGVDEIGDPKAREDLRSAVFEGFDRYPRCRWLLSSRIVGYDEVAFNENLNPKTGQSPPREALKKSRSSDARIVREHPDIGRPETAQEFDDGCGVVTRYIAPFDDGRIEKFARNWYVQREAAATRAGEDATHLVSAVHADEGILRLARIPNLLTMMALIHRIEATLPHGRALLYERIAEAYLESIDKFRGVYSGAYNLPQKRRWLARVGYEMQRRRSMDQRRENGIDEPENGADRPVLLAESSDVISWLNEEMKKEGTSQGMSAEEFLSFVGRRSGLFLPRGEGLYAFVHLSFQEYFASVAIEREVTGLNWARGEPTFMGLERKELAEWAGNSTWRETFVFLFELLASKDDWHADLLDAVFGKDFRLEEKTSDNLLLLNLAQLLARIAVNRRSGLAGNRESDAITAAVQTALRVPRSHRVFQELLGGDVDWNEKVLEVIRVQSKEAGVGSLDLAQTRISDLRPLASLAALESLSLGHTQVSDLGPLANLTALEWLSLWNTEVSDLGPVANLTALKYLYFWSTQVSDLGPLANLTALESLYFGNTEVSDLAPLANLTALESLSLWRTEVSDLGPLAHLAVLKSLDLWNTEVSDLRPLANLRRLKSLDLTGTQVSDLGPLANLTALETLDSRGTQVSDLGPLANLTALETLDLRGTQVSDLRPLANLRRLKSLDLRGTQVSDLGPLANLTALESLNVQETRVSRRVVSELRNARPECRILS